MVGLKGQAQLLPHEEISCVQIATTGAPLSRHMASGVCCFTVKLEPACPLAVFFAPTCKVPYAGQHDCKVLEASYYK